MKRIVLEKTSIIIMIIILIVFSLCGCKSSRSQSDREKHGSGIFLEDLYSEDYIARIEVEDLGEEGKLFPYGTPVEVSVRIGLWRKSEIEAESNLYLSVFWPLSEEAKEIPVEKESHYMFYPLDGSYLLDGDFTNPVDSEQWKMLTCLFFMEESEIPDEGTVYMSLRTNDSAYDINYNLSTYLVIESNNLCYEKTDEGIRVYTTEMEVDEYWWEHLMKEEMEKGSQ